MADDRPGWFARLFPLLWLLVAAALAVGAVTVLTPGRALDWVQVWPISAFVSGAWVTLVVKAFDLKGSHVLSEQEGAAFSRAVRDLRWKVWLFLCFSVAAWVIASFISKLPTSEEWHTAFAIVAVYLFLVSLGNLLLWPAFWHRIEHARDFVAHREHAEAERQKLLDRMNAAAQDGYKPIDHYRGYSETAPQ